jgi:hypothetical protein
MPDVILTGASGRLEGSYSPGKTPNAPIALILHPHPKAGGQMNNAVTVQLYRVFMKRGFATLRFNFRGVGKSQGDFDSAGLAAIGKPRRGAVLGGRLSVRSLDRHAASDAPARDRWFHLRLAAHQCV